MRPRHRPPYTTPIDVAMRVEHRTAARAVRRERVDLQQTGHRLADVAERAPCVFGRRAVHRQVGAERIADRGDRRADRRVDRRRETARTDGYLPPSSI